DSLTLPTINHFDRGLKVFNKTRVSNLDIQDLQIPNGSLRIDESTIEKHFKFSNIVVKKSGDIAVAKSTVDCSVRYENLVAGGISFLNSIINGDVYVWSGKTSSFVFNNGKFSEDFNIVGIQSEQTSIIGADFTKLLTINFD